MNQNLKRNLVKYLDKKFYILYIITLILIVLILLPLTEIIKKTFIVNGSINFSGIWMTIKNVKFRSSFYHTIVLSIGVLLISLNIGIFLSFVRCKTIFRYKKILDMLVFIHFCIPSYILSISWIQVFSRGGYINKIIKFLGLSIEYSFSPYSLGASIMVLSIHLYPLVYFALIGAFRSVDSQLEEASLLLGVSKIKSFIKVTFPLILPAIISVSLLVVSRSMANFGVVANLTLPTGKEVLTTRIFQGLSELDMTSVSVVSFIMILISLLLFHFLKSKKKNYNLKGKTECYVYKISSFKQKIFNLIIGSFFILTLLFPLLVLFLSSFLKRWGLDLKVENFTLNNYIRIFSNDINIGDSIINSVSYGFIAGLLSALILVIILYFSYSEKNFLIKILVAIVQLPLAVPNIILALAAILTWVNMPFKIYGTSKIIILTYMSLFISIMFKQSYGKVSSINPVYDTSAKILDISLQKRIFKIFLPQIIFSLISSFLICFLIALREIPISLLLYSSKTRTIGVDLFMIQSNSYGLEMTSTLSIIVIIISLIGHLFLKKISKVGKKYGKIMY